MSPEIVESICRICLSDGWQFDHVYDANQGGTADEHWITVFARNGGDAIFTADTDFVHKPPQVDAVFRTGVKVIHMPGKWGMASCYLQAAHTLAWWPRIEKQLQQMKARECYQPEWNVSGVTGAFRKMDLDFHKAQKKLKKAAA